MLRSNARHFYSIPRVIGLVGGSEDASHVNLHHFIMTLLLSTPHFASDKERLEAIVSTLAYVERDQENASVQKCDFEYLFQLAYYQIKLATTMSFSTSTVETSIE